MKIIDVRDWNASAKDTLADAAVSGGAVLDVNDNLQVLVLDLRLWNSVQDKLPSLSDVIRNIRTID